VLQVQFRGIKNNDPSQFKGIDTQTVVDPAAYESGNLIYPYEKAR
jgi:branched-chain amino acid transport system substrate-binding protein